ncbi:DNA-binding LacI/PurR family transcriptional regulator [Pullulanibacillus pueri]|uniref:LacI family transcriptional regulator n=1 Tax=Pullulanibacillus pueri TaxID=1437324 RepID=A0A8J2ZW45_9BACL|nr:LacI family DNA-binding transcriptional regulator [Pullulanibacillus pueri]MBM7682583.1 DNA-binding LacI/PurR family transcriptional regulator [Pullulanibacillus pueri]GGH82393.1 LacI family transcriptional regulator [Pullulanibacillus pueri]
MTIDDVAKKAGVSKTTVSRILNGDYSHSKEETKQRVIKTIKELNYRPNALAKGLKLMSTNIIGIVLSNLNNPFWSTVLEGVEDTCHKLGYSLMICNSDEDPKKEKHYIEEFQMRQVDGIVINPTVRNLQLYQQLVQANYPLVVINRRLKDFSINQVIGDNVQGSKLAVNHLLDNGRKKIAVTVYKNPYVSTWKERVEGYREAMLINGFSAYDLRILEIDPLSKSIKQVTMDFLKRNHDTDAVYSTNNMITLELIDAIRQLNLKIPEDIAIVSYDETPWAKYLEPPLTTVNQPGYEMGKIATQILVRSITEKNAQRPETVVLKPKLIIRESSNLNRQGLDLRR